MNTEKVIKKLHCIVEQFFRNKITSKDAKIVLDISESYIPIFCLVFYYHIFVCGARTSFESFIGKALQEA